MNKRIKNKKLKQSMNGHNARPAKNKDGSYGSKLTQIKRFNIEGESVLIELAKRI